MGGRGEVSSQAERGRETASIGLECMHACMYFNTCMHTYIHTYIQACMHACRYFSLYIHTHGDARQACMYDTITQHI